MGWQGWGYLWSGGGCGKLDLHAQNWEHSVVDVKSHLVVESCGSNVASLTAETIQTAFVPAL